MPKKVFWPSAMIAMGLVFLAHNLGLLPREFGNLWPLILIVVGLGGLLTCDRDEWMHETSSRSMRKSTPKKRK
ncbi:hypothetical protein H3C66_00655 [Patescibacteria group bacterium]|nr:hypothetical protein [Patescibacteria group bacterium]